MRQGPAFFLTGQSDAQVSKAESGFALTGLITCIVLFLGYLMYQVRYVRLVDELRYHYGINSNHHYVAYRLFLRFHSSIDDFVGLGGVCMCFFFSHFDFPASGEAVVTGFVPSPPGSGLQFLSRIGFSNPIAISSRFFIECC